MKFRINYTPGVITRPLYPFRITSDVDNHLRWSERVTLSGIIAALFNLISTRDKGVE